MFSFLRLSYSLRVKKILVDAVQKIASKQKDTTEIVSKHGYIRKVRFEPVHHITAARRISSPVHYHSANLPQVLFLNFSHEMSSLFLTDK